MIRRFWPAAGFVDAPSLAMLAAIGLLGVVALSPDAKVPAAAAPTPAAAPGTGIAYAPFVFLDNDTGCQYLSTHNSTALAPRIGTDGKTHMGCKGSTQ